MDLQRVAPPPPPRHVNGRNTPALHSVSEQRCAVTIDHSNLSYYNTVLHVGRHTAQLIKTLCSPESALSPHLWATACTGQVMS